MTFDKLYTVMANQPYFDYETVRLFFANEDPAQTRTALYRFVKTGKLVQLRRGLYCFSVTYRKTELHGAYIAGLLYPPSYLSGYWALSWYGIIPEKTVLFTSLTTRITKSFQNEWGRFTYRTVKKEAFFGFEEVLLSEQAVLLALPEKALLDTWYLEAGEWTAERMELMRFNPQYIDQKQLCLMTARFKSARLDRALKSWTEYTSCFDEGEAV